MELCLKKTINGTHRVLVNGNVHPLLCGFTNYKDAVDRTKKVLALEEVELMHHRFHIGEQYVFLAEKFVKNSQTWTSMYLPWVDELQSLQIVVLECVSQHHVPGEWEDEIKYKGYKFKLVKSNIEHELFKPGLEFHNQFPHASYGQLSTDADYYAHPHLINETDIKSYLNAEIGGGLMGRFEEAGTKIDNIYRGIRSIKERVEKEKVDLSKEIKALEDYLKNTITPEIEKIGFQVVTKPYISWFIDGSVEQYDDMTDTSVILK